VFTTREPPLNMQNQRFEKISALLEHNNILANPAEIQAMFCGMLGGGMPLECRDWDEPIADFVNQGDPLPPEVQEAFKQLYNTTCQQLVDTDFALVLCLPDDSAPINERGQALLSWVQGFMLGFGLHQADLTGCSDDVKEGLEDFAEIARMDEEMSEDEESERALFEVLEYVRVTAMLCFNELGKSPEEQQSQPKTVH
jgi:uncharacterized protein YgfB (UPF0149 family)